MLKRYEFHSKLSPEQIFARMEIHGKSVKRSGKWDDWWMEYKRKQNNAFSLYMSCAREIFPGFPFLGTVERQGGGSVIRGQFALFGNNLRTLLAFLALPVGGSLLFGFSISAAFVVWLIVVIAETLGLFALFYGIGKSNAGLPVLNFIQKNLLE